MFKYILFAGAGYALATVLTPKKAAPIVKTVVKTVGGREVVVTEVNNTLAELPSSSSSE